MDPWLAVAARAEPARSWAPMGLAFGLAAALAFVSVTATRDRLEWNRVRWCALHDLGVARGVPPARIDGGFEFNGLYLHRSGRPRRGVPKSSWWVEDDECVVAVAEIRGYRTLLSYSPLRWLPPGTARILVLGREAVQDRELSPAHWA